MTEWTGSYPQKFGKTKKHTSFVTGVESTKQGLYGDVDTGIEVMKGRKHFSMSACQKYYEWKPCFRKVAQETLPTRSSGVRKFSPVYTEPKPRAEKRHVTPSQRTLIKELFNDSFIANSAGKRAVSNRIW